MKGKRSSKSTKKGKKSKKSSRGSKTDWMFDGYGPSSGSGDSVEGNTKPAHRGPRKTQDKDERLRRSRMKHEDKRLKSNFINKMRQKVRFTDVLEKQEPEIQQDDDLEKKMELELKEKRREQSNKRNPVSVADRLFQFLSNDRMNENDDDIDTDEDDGEDAEEDDEHSSQEDTELPQDIDDEIKSMVHVVEEADLSDDEDNFEDDDIEHMGSTTSEHYKNFFSSSSAVSKDPKKLTINLISNIADDLSLYGSSQIPSSIPSCFSSLKDMPNLFKLWKSRSSQPIKGISSKLLPYLTAYCDAFIEGRDHHNDQEILHGILLHLCVHTVKSRAIVLKHNQRLKKKLADAKIEAAITTEKSKRKSSRKSQSKAAPPAESTPSYAATLAEDDIESDEANRDQGYCRPRVLILCPFRSSALRIVQTMKEIFGPNTTLANYDKFVDEYSYISEDDEVSNEKKEKLASRLPNDWKELFHEQNIDDDFKLGIQVNVGQGKGSGSDKGVYLRLYSDFMISDIVIASPLALRFIIDNSNAEATNTDKKNSYDFLSSLEIITIHQADVIFMQNWDHVQHIFQYVNKAPTSLHDLIDFSRVRKYFLEQDLSQFHRQLIMTSHFLEPEIQSFYRQYSTSMHSNIRVKKLWDKVSNSSPQSNHEDMTSLSLPISQISSQIRQQVFQRINSINVSIDSIDDERFKYFTNKVLKPILRAEQQGILIVTPKYFDYVRVRNELMRLEVSLNIYIVLYI